MVHSSNKFQNILSVVDPSSKDYQRLEKIANRRLKQPSLVQDRKEFEKDWELKEINTVTKYFNTLAQPEDYKDNKKEVDEILLSLYKTSSPRNTTNKAIKINSFKTWAEFTAVSNKKDVTEQRVELLKRLFENNRNSWLQKIWCKEPTNDMPRGFKENLKAFTSIHENIKGINKELSPPKKVTDLANDYCASKQQVQSIGRCDFIAATRVMELMLDGFDLQLSDEFQKVANYSKIFELGISMFSIGDDCINVLEAPKIALELAVNNNNNNPETYRLHSEKIPAYNSTDTGEVHFLHGIFVEKALWRKCKSKTIKPEEIFLIKNIEQRRVVIEAVGADVIVNTKNAEHGKVSEHGNQLIRIRNIKLSDDDKRRLGSDGFDVLIVKYKDPSTSRVYHSFVPPVLDPQARESKERTDPDEALAWKFGKTKEAYYGGLMAEA